MSVEPAVIYDELLAVKVELDFEDDPRPSTLQDKIIECNGAMRKVEKRMIQVTRELAGREKDLKIEEARLEVKKRSLLINDPEIKKKPTGKEREAAADEMLEGDLKKLLDMGNAVAELHNLQSSIKLVHQNLKTTNSDIRTLMRIMEQQISRLNVGTRDDKEVKDLMDGLGEADELDGEMTLDDVESSAEGDEAREPDGPAGEGIQDQTDTPSDGDGSDGAEDELDSLESFIADGDSESNGGEEAPDDEPKGDGDDGSAQSAVAIEGEPDNAQNVDATEAAGNGGGGSDEGGLDIDLGDILGGDAEAAPPKPQDKPAEPAGETKPEGPPPKQDGSGDDFDIEDLLGSLDV